MNGEQNNQYSLPAFSIIEAATNGDSVAINAILKHYERYISALSIRKFHDKNGLAYKAVDEELRRMLEIKLITKILDFKLVREV